MSLSRFGLPRAVTIAAAAALVLGVRGLSILFIAFFDDIPAAEKPLFWIATAWTALPAVAVWGVDTVLWYVLPKPSHGATAIGRVWRSAILVQVFMLLVDCVLLRGRVFDPVAYLMSGMYGAGVCLVILLAVRAIQWAGRVRESARN